MKKNLLWTAVTVMSLSLLLLAGCTSANAAGSQSGGSQASAAGSGGGEAGIDETSSWIEGLPNPIEEMDSAKAVSEAVGFDFVPPSWMPGDFSEQAFSVIHLETGDIAQVHFTSVSAPEERIVFRASMNVDGETMNGDWTVYSVRKTLHIAQCQVACQGEGETVSVASWEKDAVQYVLMSDRPLTQAELMSILESTQEVPDTAGVDTRPETDLAGDGLSP